MSTQEQPARESPDLDTTVDARSEGLHGTRDETKMDIKEVVTENEQIYSLLVSSITKEVHDRLEIRGTRTRSMLIGVSSLVLAALVAIGGFLINELLEIRVGQAVQNALSGTLNQAIYLTELASLDMEARTLREGEGFTREQAESIIRKIEALYRKGVTIVEDPELSYQNIERLRFAVESAILSFAQGNRADFVIDLERKAPRVVQESASTSALVVASLGDFLLEDARAPESWEAVLSEEYEKYRYYSKLARSSGYPELHLLYELLTGYVKDVNSAHLRALISDLEDLEPRDREGLKDRLQEILSSPGDTKGSGRAARIAEAFLAEYGGSSPVLRELSVPSSP